MIAPATETNPFNIALVMFATFEVPAKAILPAICPAPNHLAGYWIKSVGRAVNSPPEAVDRVTICAMFQLTKDQKDAFDLLARSFPGYSFDPMRFVKELWPSICGPAVIQFCHKPQGLSLDELDNQFDAVPEAIASLLPRNAV